MPVDPLNALVVFLLWLCVALAIGLLTGRIFKGPGERPPVDEQEPDRLSEVAHFCEARSRRDARNGLGKAS